MARATTARAWLGPAAGRRLNLPRFPGRFLFAWVAVIRGSAQPCLILHRAQVAKRRVPPGPVVHGLEPPEHLQAGLFSGVPVAPVDQLALQGGKEARVWLHLRDWVSCEVGGPEGGG